jgi:hypothetical protein
MTSPKRLKKKIRRTQYELDAMSFRLIEASSIMEYLLDQNQQIVERLKKLKKKYKEDVDFEPVDCECCDCPTKRFCNEHCDCECCEYLDEEELNDENVGE